MNTKRRNVIVAFGTLVGAAVLSGVAAAGCPHGTPPGQAKHQSAAVAAGASVSGNATAHGRAKHESTVAAGASVSVKVRAHGRTKHQSTAVVVGTSTSNATGVKSSATTGFNTHAAAASSSTKLYGNGRTAGQIAEQHGAGASAMLFGPGNSQPHKAALCSTTGFVHLVDVHALKVGVTGPCVAAALSSNGSTTAVGSGAVGGSANGSAHGNGVGVTGSVHGNGVGAGAKAHASGRIKAIRLHGNSGVLGAQHSVSGSVTAQAQPAQAVLGTANFTG